MSGPNNYEGLNSNSPENELGLFSWCFSVFKFALY